MSGHGMSGPLVRIAGGALEVELLPSTGARLHRLRAFGVDLLRTPADLGWHAHDPFIWGGYVMAPWGGRIAAEPTPVGGKVVDLASNFPDGSAIHGQVAAMPWEETAQGTFGVRAGGDGWPWPYEVSLAVAIEEAAATLALRLAVTNLADEPMPAGLGLHPWFLRPLDVRLRGTAVFRSNLASAGQPEPVAGTYDLQSPGPMPDGIDATWVDLGDPAVELRWPDRGVTATLRARSTAGGMAIVAASPIDMDAIAVEPQTHAPQGLRRLLQGEPYGLQLLEPGDTLRLSVQLAFRS